MHRLLVLYPPPVDPAAFRAYYNYATAGAVLLRFDVREGETATPGG